MTDADKAALELCMERYKAQDKESRQQIASMLKDSSWHEVAIFACSNVQYQALCLKPWQTPPCFVDEDDPEERAQDAQLLLQRMLAAGISRYHPDPLTALRRSGGHGGFARSSPI